MDYLIFSIGIVVLFLLIWLIFFLNEYMKYGGWKSYVSVGNSVWNLRGHNDNYKKYDWNKIANYLTDFFKYNPDLKLEDDFKKIELYDDPNITNGINSKICNGSIEFDNISAWRFKRINFISLNLLNCQLLGVDDKGMTNLILHEYCHLYQFRKLGNDDVNHTNREMWIKFTI